MTVHLPTIKKYDYKLALQVPHTHLSVTVMHHCNEPIKNHLVVHNLSSQGSLLLLPNKGFNSFSCTSQLQWHCARSLNEVLHLECRCIHLPIYAAQQPRCQKGNLLSLLCKPSTLVFTNTDVYVQQVLCRAVFSVQMRCGRTCKWKNRRTHISGR